MQISLQVRGVVRWAAVVGVSLVAVPLVAAHGQEQKVKKDSVATGVVEMFAAIEKGQIAVQIFPHDATQARLVVTNKTTEPISVALPPAFAATPVLAQFNNPLQAKAKAPQPLGVAPPQAMNANNLNGRNNAGPNMAAPNQLGPLFEYSPGKGGTGEAQNRLSATGARPAQSASSV